MSVIADDRKESRAQFACLVFLLITTTFIAYMRVLRNGFLTWDDPFYVSSNRHVIGGISRAGISWAFRSMEGGNWHPLTWISHMLDCQIYGLEPAYHHLNNLLLHIGNTLLLFLLLWRTTRSQRRSALVAALFALHPLHVESVAWASERKDMLSSFFGLLALLCYADYARRPGTGRYLLVGLLFVLSLLSKPMLVTLPFLLLLLDVWPLRRLTWNRAVIMRRVLEKVPLLFLSLLSSMVAVVTQVRGGAVETLEAVPFASRLANSVVSYSFYVWKMVWPAGLAFLYPRPVGWPLSVVLVSVALLAFGSVLALAVGRRRPEVLIGWLWYIGTAIPIIGLVQVGMQFAADRYTYFPLIGLFITIVWLVPQSWLQRTSLFACFLGTTFLFLGLMTHRQVGYWSNSATLFQRGLDVTKDNQMAHYFLADYLSGIGQNAEAAIHYGEARRIKRERARPQVERAVLQAKQAGFDEALAHFLAELRLHPTDTTTNLALRAFLRQSGKPDRDISRALHRVATVLDAGGNLPEAIGYYREAVRLDPDFPRAQNDLGAALASYGELGTAIVHLSKALRLRPESAEARDNLALALAKYAEVGSSRSPYPSALRQAPDLVSAQVLLGDTLRRAGHLAEARAYYEQALHIAPGNQDAMRGLAAFP